MVSAIRGIIFSGKKQDSVRWTVCLPKTDPENIFFPLDNPNFEEFFITPLILPPLSLFLHPHRGLLHLSRSLISFPL